MFGLGAIFRFTLHALQVTGRKRIIEKEKGLIAEVVKELVHFRGLFGIELLKWNQIIINNLIDNNTVRSSKWTNLCVEYLTFWK